MSDTHIQEIKDRLDIVEVVSAHVQLKRAGTNYKGLCPFHQEKSGSFMVSAAKQIWHCFGCGQGGDVIEFVRKIENLSFPEVLEELAGRTGVTLPTQTRHINTVKIDTEQFYKINSFAAKFYHAKLMSDAGAAAKAYLNGRGLLPQTLTGWQIGFAPDSFNSLKDALLVKGVQEKDLVAAGVCARAENGRVYDRFRNRITYPITDLQGRVVGFSARDFSGQADAAKYINSPETAIYYKSKVVFGLYQARGQLRALDYGIIVEGQMDCISAHQAGFLNTLATSGTALTLEQLRLIARFTKSLMFCFDQDAAGQEAAFRAGLLALQNGFAVKMVRFTEAKDPDELIRQNPQGWKNALATATWFAEHYINRGLQEYEFGSVAQKKYVTDILLPVLSAITDPIEKDHYTQLIAAKYAVSTQALNSPKPGTVKSRQTEVQAEPIKIETILDTRLNTEKELLGGILVYPEIKDALVGEFNPKIFKDVKVAEAANLAISGQAQVYLELAAEAKFMVELGLERHAGNTTAYMRELIKSYNTLKLLELKEQLQRLTNSIKQAEARGERDLLQKFNTEYAMILAQRSRLELKD